MSVIAKQEHASAPTVRPSPVLDFAGWCVLSLPVVALAITCFRTSVNIPLEDDFGIGQFIELWLKAPTFADKLKLFVGSQHVQYKLYFMHVVELIQYYLIGASNYRVLGLLGDAGLLAVPLILWFLLARSGRPLSQRIWLFIFPCFLFLSPRYIETINWALSGLQNICVIPFAITAIFFLTSRRRHPFLWSIAFLVLSIATSGNGFFLVFVFLYLLLRSRRFREALITIAVSALIAVVYAYHYRVYSATWPLPLSQSIHRKILFPFVFLGGAAAHRDLAFAFGVLLIIGFVLLARKGWARACEGSFGVALFCIFTTIGVTYTRANGGVPGALSERYMMYGLLLACVEYIAVLRLYAPARFNRRSSWLPAIGGLSVAAIVLCAFSEVLAYRQLEARRETLITHLILWERHPDHLVLIPDEGPDKQTPIWIFRRSEFQKYMTREIRLGIYHPPYTANDVLPIRTHSPATEAIENERP